MSGILSRYIKGINRVKHFIGDPKDKDVFFASTILAEACNHFKEDDLEEIYVEDTRSCYNCRYRRWAREGFNCYKNFDISTADRG